MLLESDKHYLQQCFQQFEVHSVSLPRFPSALDLKRTCEDFRVETSRGVEIVH